VKEEAIEELASNYRETLEFDENIIKSGYLG
jgi:hypothetical protein